MVIGVVFHFHKISRCRAQLGLAKIPDRRMANGKIIAHDMSIYTKSFSLEIHHAIVKKKDFAGKAKNSYPFIQGPKVL